MLLFRQLQLQPSGSNRNSGWKNLPAVFGFLLSTVLLSSCYTTSGGWSSSGDFETKNFYISEIVVNEAKPSTLENWTTTEKVSTTPSSNRLSIVLHQHAAAYNKLKDNPQIGLRLKVRFLTNYSATSAGGAALEVVAASVLSSGNPRGNTIGTKSTLVDPKTGRELWSVNDSYNKNDFLPDKEKIEPILFNGISDKIMRSVFSLRSTPEGVSEFLRSSESLGLEAGQPTLINDEGT